MKKIIASVLAILLSLSCLMTASAVTPGDSYVYDFWEETVEAPQGYEPVRSVNALEMGASQLTTPEDMYYSAASRELYITDTGNNRIVVLDQDLKFVREYKTFQQADGTETTLNKPYGVFVDQQNRIYIADRENKRVLISDQSGAVVNIIERPESDVFPSNVEFMPIKVTVDNSGMVYVLVSGLFYGAVQYDAEGNFVGFYGSNRVNLSIAQMLDLVWRQLFAGEDTSTIERYVPVEFSNITCDSSNYIYTCTRAMSTSEKIKKLNAMGINILNETDFGDLEVVWTTGGVIEDTQFVDIAVDENGFVNALDFERGRIFQYDEEGKLVFVTGGLGNQTGVFTAPTAIECVGSEIWVLDREKENLTIFEPTQYALSVQAAMDLYNQGRYEDAIGPWQEVLTQNQNNYYAHSSLGKAYYDQGKYKLAMEQFKLGNDREEYSRAFKEYRTEFIRQYFVLFAIVLLLVLVGFVLLIKRKRVKAFLIRHHVNIKERPPRPMKGIRYIGYILRHPVEGYEELKYKKAGSFRIAVVILLLWFFGTVLTYQFKGFIFNTNKLEQMNIFVLFATTIVPFLLWVISNWCFCTLLDGKGRAKEIFVFSAYALVPYVIMIYVTLILSNVFTMDEGIFNTWLLVVSQLYSALLLFNALKVMHEYSGGKTIVSVLLTLLGMFIIIFLITLAFSLVQQVYSFVSTIIKEFMYRTY